MGTPSNRRGDDLSAEARSLLQLSDRNNTAPIRGEYEMDVKNVVSSRYSCRKFADRPIEQEKIEQIMEAARLAPTASNEQHNKHIVVTDKELIRSMVPACKDQKWVETAAAILVECAIGDRTMICGHSARLVDASIAMSYMNLQAVELGLQGTWLGWFYPEKVKKVLDLPEEYEVYAVMPIGYPDDGGRPREKKPAEEVVIYKY